MLKTLCKVYDEVAFLLYPVCWQSFAHRYLCTGERFVRRTRNSFSYIFITLLNFTGFVNFNFIFSAVAMDVLSKANFKCYLKAKEI